MSVTAKLKHLRIAPRKVRLVADMIRGQKVDKAKSYLEFTVKRSSAPLLKLLNSAIVNAKNKESWEESNLFISSITVDEGPKLKRWRARARGSAAPIHKKTSHIIITLNELKENKNKENVGKKRRQRKEKDSKIETKKVSSLSEIKDDFKKDSKDTEKNKKAGTGKIDKKQAGDGKQQLKQKVFRRKSI